MVLNLFKYVMSFFKQETRTLEKPSPQVFIDYPKKSIVLNGKRYTVKGIADTNSMDPVFDVGHKAILKTFMNDDIIRGDILIYKHNKMLISHRVVKIGMDYDGIYYICQGDNNFKEDPWKVRKNMIKYILVGVLY